MKGFKIFVLVLFGLVVGLGVAEVAARFLLPPPTRQIALLRMRAPDLQMDAGTDLKKPDYNPFIQRRPHSNWVCDGIHPELMNNEGFRDEDFVRSRIPGKRRIALIGDSFVEGWMGPRSVAFPRVVQQVLGSSFEVMNFGLANRSPLRYLALYDQIVRKYQPDMVLVCLYQNDLQEDRDLLPYATLDERGVPIKFDYVRYFQDTPRMPQTRWERRRDRWQWLACQHSRLFPYIAVYFSVNPEFRHRILNAPSRATQEGLWSDTESHLRALFQVIRKDSTFFSLAYVPDLGDFSTPSLLLEKSRDFAARERIPFFEPGSFMKQSSPDSFYLKGDGHFSEEGHRAYGLELSAWLVKKLPDSRR